MSPLDRSRELFEQGLVSSDSDGFFRGALDSLEAVGSSSVKDDLMAHLLSLSAPVIFEENECSADDLDAWHEKFFRAVDIDSKQVIDARAVAVLYAELLDLLPYSDVEHSVACSPGSGSSSLCYAWDEFTGASRALISTVHAINERVRQDTSQYEELLHKSFDLFDSGHVIAALDVLERKLGMSHVHRRLTDESYAFSDEAFFRGLEELTFQLMLVRNSTSFALINANSARAFFSHIEEEVVNAVNYAGGGDTFSPVVFSALYARVLREFPHLRDVEAYGEHVTCDVETLTLNYNLKRLLEGLGAIALGTGEVAFNHLTAVMSVFHTVESMFDSWEALTKQQPLSGDDISEMFHALLNDHGPVEVREIRPAYDAHFVSIGIAALKETKVISLRKSVMPGDYQVRRIRELFASLNVDD